LTRPKFTSRQLFTLTALAAVICAFVAAGPYMLLVFTALILCMLPAFVVAAITACFSSAKARTAKTSMLLIPFFYILFPWGYVQPDIYGVAKASIVVGVFASIAAVAINILRARIFDRDQRIC
jgi:hypothetical protein